MVLRVNVVCRNFKDDRIIARMARALRDRLGWSLTAAAPSSDCDVLYLSAYFEGQRLKPWPDIPVAAYFTHREEDPPGNSKAELYDAMAARVNLRVATCRLYADPLSEYGPTAQCAAPLERDRFVLGSVHRRKTPVIGFSGYTYRNHRKGEDLAKGVVASAIGQRVKWRASGRGWPVPTKRYAWAEMPAFMQSLDVLVIPSRVEGIPMPPLEALACGVPVVIPRGVGLHDELPDIAGIYRYERGDLDSLLTALELAAFPTAKIDRKTLRAATAPYSIEAWARDNEVAVTELIDGNDSAGILQDVPETPDEGAAPITIPAELAEPTDQGTEKTRGIYCVAFGEPARESCLRLLTSAKKYMPDIPIALCAGRKIGPEDVLIVQPDSDIGGRRAKLKAYALAPGEWQSVLYLDADTEVVAPIYRYFEWIEDGWEFVICKDPHLRDTMHAFERRNNKVELEELEKSLRTLNALQLNGGVWAFGRNDRIARFFQRWLAEWERYAQRDQGALIRALYADPLKTLVLDNEWNCFPKYSKGIEPAGLMHYPGDARRWKGMIPGRIDSKDAWAAVKRFERTHRRRGA